MRTGETTISSAQLKLDQKIHRAEEKRRKDLARTKKKRDRRVFEIGEKVCTAFPQLMEIEDTREMEKLDAVLAYLQKHREILQHAFMSLP